MAEKSVMASDKQSNRSRHCPLCNASEACVVAQMSAQQIINSSAYYDDSWYARLQVEPQSTFSISKCDSCHFVFSSQVPSDAFLDQVYGFSRSIESSVATFARPARAAFAYRSLAKLLDAIDANVKQDERGVVADKIKILDIGCAFGVGSLGLAVEHYPYEVSGVEWSPATREYLTKQGMRTYKTLGEIDDSLQFDGIILNDVLEHVPDPASFVAELKTHCHQNTAVWVNVPDFSEWRTGEIIAQVNSGSMTVPKDMNPWEHLSYFSPSALNRLMESAGFTRWSQSQVDYRIRRGSFVESIKTLLRTLRDSWRIYQGRYPNEYLTSDIFVLTDRLAK